MSRGIVPHASHLATMQLWGVAGLNSVAALLPPDTRAATIDQPIEPLGWMPERHQMAWFEAVFQGPCKNDDVAYCAWVDRMMDLSFGRVRRMMLAAITPQGLIERAAELWRHDHSHGTLRVTTSSSGAIATLHDHPFTRSATTRRAMAEVYRYAISLSRAKDVRETHLLDARGDLVVRLSWK